MGFIGVRLSTIGKYYFVSLGYDKYFIEYNTIQYSTVVVIIYDNNSVIDIGYKYTTSSWNLNGFPNGSNLGSTI